MGGELTNAGMLFERLRIDGEKLLETWRSERRPEGVNLECKRPAPSQQPGMTDSDIKTLAKTASAFANSEGGVLIFGVDARDINGTDAIQSLVPIDKIAAFARSAERVRADLLSPPHPDIEMLLLPSNQGEDAGYLVVRIERSEKRPHRSLKDHAYYRRSGDRTSVMEHSDLKDAMSRTLGPELQIEIDISDIIPDEHRSIQQANSFTILASLSLRNTGGSMARHPFIHFETSVGGGLYDPATQKRLRPAWPRLLSEIREHRLQGGTDDVIPVSTTVRAAFAFWTYKRDTATISGMPLGAAHLSLVGRFGCDGAQTQSFQIDFSAPEIIGELQKRSIPLTPITTWP